MKGIRRKYIALLSVIVFIVVFILRYIAHQDFYQPNEAVKIYFEFAVFILQVLLTLIVFKTKNNDAKNLITAFTVIITALYILMYFYTSFTS
jgi:cytochrome bd-type quinol oxidase subunit 2